MKILYLLVVIAFLNAHCSDRYDCEMGPPAPEWGKYYSYKPFDHSTGDWLDTIPPKLSFINNKGHLANFSLAKIDTNTSRTTILAHAEQKECGTKYTNDYIIPQRLELRYEPEGELFDIRILKILNAEKVVFVGNEPTGFFESLLFIIAGKPVYYSQNEDYKPEYQKTFLNSITLNTKEFTDVWKITFTQSAENPGWVKTLYYHSSHGLMAFEFTTGELWTKY